MVAPRLLAMPLGWVIRHLVLLTVVAFVLVGYGYRQAIFSLSDQPEATEGGVAADRPVEEGDSDGTVADRPAVPEEREGPREGGVDERKAAGPVESPASSPVEVMAIEARPLEDASRGPAETPEPDAPSPPVSKPPQDSGETTMGQPQVADPVASHRPDAAPSPAPEIARLPVDDRDADYRFRPLEATPAPLPPIRESELERLRQEARRAYWSGDPAASERLYMELLEKAPDDPDLHGELGNVRYQSGDMKGAVAAYRQAAGLLQPVDPERARRLEQRIRLIESAVSKEPGVSRSSVAGDRSE